jgi:hypothetical protein
MSIHAVSTVENAVRCTTATGEPCPLGSQCSVGCTPPLSNRPSDELVLQHLGAAVMLCWSQLPLGARDQILRQADDVVGFAPLPQIRNEIVGLMLRRAKVQWAAALLSVRSIRSPDRSLQMPMKLPSIG